MNLERYSPIKQFCGIKNKFRGSGFSWEFYFFLESQEILFTPPIGILVLFLILVLVFFRFSRNLSIKRRLKCNIYLLPQTGFFITIFFLPAPWGTFSHQNHPLFLNQLFLIQFGALDFLIHRPASRGQRKNLHPNSFIVNLINFEAKKSSCHEYNFMVLFARCPTKEGIKRVLEGFTFSRRRFSIPQGTKLHFFLWTATKSGIETILEFFLDSEIDGQNSSVFHVEHISFWFVISSSIKRRRIASKGCFLSSESSLGKSWFGVVLGAFKVFNNKIKVFISSKSQNKPAAPIFLETIRFVF